MAARVRVTELFIDRDQERAAEQRGGGFASPRARMHSPACLAFPLAAALLACSTIITRAAILRMARAVRRVHCSPTRLCVCVLTKSMEAATSNTCTW